MNSKERVMAVFNHQIPDRVPMWCGASPEFMEKARVELGLGSIEDVYVRFHDDFRRVYARYAGPEIYHPEYTTPEGKNISVFGIERHGIGYGQAIYNPLAEATLEEVNNYNWPDPEWYDVSHIREDALAWDGEYAVLGGEWCPFFHDAVDLLGMENMMILMYEEPEIVHAVMEHIVDYYYAISKRIFEAAKGSIDIFFIGNDLGSQKGPLLGENLFREFLYPHLKRLTDLGKEYGIPTMMHCCGNFAKLIPSVIDCGIAAVQSLQPVAECMRAPYLKEHFGGKIILNGGIDSVNLLINGTAEQTKKAVCETLRVMKPGGGYILSPSHDYLLPETKVENVIAMYDTALEYGQY